MLNRTEHPLGRFIAAAGLAIACGAGIAAANPPSLPVALYELVVISGGEAYVTDYGLTLSDCVGLWDDYPVTVGLECNPA